MKQNVLDILCYNVQIRIIKFDFVFLRNLQARLDENGAEVRELRQKFDELKTDYAKIERVRTHDF